jgi:hypothetical protein
MRTMMVHQADRTGSPAALEEVSGQCLEVALQLLRLHALRYEAVRLATTTHANAPASGEPCLRCCSAQSAGDNRGGLPDSTADPRTERIW